MATANHTRAASREEDCPLWLHRGTGQWCKKIKGKRYYFGTNKTEAVKRYHRDIEDLLAGREPKPDGVTVEYLCDHYLTYKDQLVSIGELSQRSFKDYRSTCDRIVRVFGRNRSVDNLHPDDFKRLRADIAKTRGPTALGNEINRCRMVFRYAHDEGLVDSVIRFGKTFERPSKKTLRLSRSKKPKKLFTPSEIHRLIDDASVPMKAMILVGLNTGMGNHDVGLLSESHVDLDRGWLDYPRSKTGVERTAPLWPETIEALEAARAVRPKPTNPRDHHLFFVTRYGHRWSRDDGSDAPVSKEFRKILLATKIHREGFGFYCLRHCFQTIGERTGDLAAVRHIMGHADSSMSAQYREGFEPERLQAVVDCVRNWLKGVSK